MFKIIIMRTIFEIFGYVVISISFLALVWFVFQLLVYFAKQVNVKHKISYHSHN